MIGVDELGPLDRVIARWQGSRKGPLVVSIGGIHGNEASGVLACRRVLEVLAETRPPFRGEWLAVAGNLPALARNQRFIEEDLNRIWLPDRIRARGAGEPEASLEARELDGILSEVEASLQREPTEAYFIDLHTTSAPGSPFSVFSDTLHNRRLAEHLPAPMVLGLEENVEGTFLNYINYLGHVAVAFEAGQHGTRAAVQAHERALWRTLLAAGLIEFGDLPDQIRRRVGRLGSIHSEPRLVEIVHRHVVGPNDAFVMRPGFENLQRIRAGDVLARDRNGDIASEYNGRILMPLYQSQGDDGFFIVRDLHPVWLPVSAFCRRLGLGALVVYLPGVRRHPTLADAVIVDRRIPRWIVTRIFHLLGYGKWSEDAHAIVMRWRRETPRRRSSQ